ncbi:S1C family serine protease [Agrococcus jejuensis]|uniref:Putative serine protease PepD n=1 Tax=Agrococcus jejuensis TaxID=399736 RepID=A0A1G8GA44_9MICO|nr:trypsin-like peptidase domain-containing protein [Agrococcus jejuensis]SDH91254.1 putative serine protease PepD [Agrococcus jejuensis]
MVPMTNDERGQVPPDHATGWPHEPQQEAAWGQASREVPPPPTAQQQSAAAPEQSAPQQASPQAAQPAASAPQAQPGPSVPQAPQVPQVPNPWQQSATAPQPQAQGHVPNPAAQAHATVQQPAWQQPASTPFGPHAPQGAHAGSAFAQAPGTGASAPVKPRRRRRPIAALALAGLLGGTVLGGAAGATAATLVAQHGGSSTSAASDVTITGASATDPQTIADVAQTASQSVVTVEAVSSAGSGTGSGVVVGDGGIIVTNNHVVTLDGAASDATITVETSDGQLLEATVVGTDPTVDLAVLRVDADLPVITFVDSDSVSVGDTAIAIGAPLGLSNSVTDGIVSAVDRGLQISPSATQDDSSAQSQQSPFGFWSQGGAQAAQETISIPVIQTDASINPGNSGGALLNAAGQLMGVNVAIASMSSSDSSSQAGSIGIGFAIEASLVQRVVDEIVSTGTATHGLLGASVGDVTDASVGHTGAQLADITADGAAAAAGLQSGDVVTAVDGTPVTSATDLTAQIRAEAGGASVTLTILRGGSEQDVDVTLGTLS